MNAPSDRERRAFFFPHPLEPQQTGKAMSIPGRVPYEVSGTLLGPNGAQNGTCIVMADGFFDALASPPTGVVGSNQDPCVFSAPWGPFHSFCRIDGANIANERVVVGSDAQATASLAEAVAPGDVILYGKSEPASRVSLVGGKLRRVWIDTVLVVDEVVEAPLGPAPEGKTERPFDFASNEAFPKKGTDAYRFNLSDGEPKGMHPTTARDPHRIIKGKTSHEADALATLATSFVPLADRIDGIHHVCAVDKGHLGAQWAGVVQFFEERVFGAQWGTPRGGWIAQFDSFAVAEALVAAVVKRSGLHQGMRGTVAIPPLAPTSARRWDPRAKKVV